MRITGKIVVFVVMLVGFYAMTSTAVGQAKSSPPKTIFRDSDGDLISNNEFVDIRMANFHYPDATRVTTLADGSTEFWLQKIPQEGMAAPVVSVKTIDGKALRLSDLRGKVVVLNFWFIGCPVCRAHKPKLDELAVKFSPSDDVVFVAMTPDPAGETKKYLKREPSVFLQIADAQDEMKKFRFAGYPKNIVISRGGEIVYWRSTIKAWDKFESVIRAELARK
jgi:thiol-disulfide isomerase/thioredoxin